MFDKITKFVGGLFFAVAIDIIEWAVIGFGFVSGGIGAYKMFF